MNALFGRQHFNSLFEIVSQSDLSCFGSYVTGRIMNSGPNRKWSVRIVEHYTRFHSVGIKLLLAFSSSTWQGFKLWQWNFKTLIILAKRLEFVLNSFFTIIGFKLINFSRLSNRIYSDEKLLIIERLFNASRLSKGIIRYWRSLKRVAVMGPTLKTFTCLLNAA